MTDSNNSPSSESPVEQQGAARSGADTERDCATRRAEIIERVRRAAESASRSPDSVSIIAVSKHQPIEKVRELIQAGHRIFGENYVQEARLKFAELRLKSPDCPAVSFHGIGKLQRNKARDAVSMFDLIHTIDRIELADEVSRSAAKLGKCQQVLLQIKVSEEETKSGCDPDSARALLDAVLALPNVEVRGLMCIGRNAPEGITEGERVKEFRLLRTLRDELARSAGVALPELSMGMSDDFEIAVQEGATLIRVGTALFGPRLQHREVEK